jgi:hypothetical protein
VAAELGRGVQDCVSRSTLLHLQELQRASRPPVPTATSTATATAKPQQSQRKQQQAGGALPRSPAFPPAPPPPSSSSSSLQGARERAVVGSASGSPAVPLGGAAAPVGGLLASEVAALARRHEFDWAAVGASCLWSLRPPCAVCVFNPHRTDNRTTRTTRPGTDRRGAPGRPVGVLEAL